MHSATTSMSSRHAAAASRAPSSTDSAPWPCVHELWSGRCVRTILRACSGSPSSSPRRLLLSGSHGADLPPRRVPLRLRSDERGRRCHPQRARRAPILPVGRRRRQ
jgi:hypothetical protein